MTEPRVVYDFDGISRIFVTKASSYIANRYRHWGVVFDDVSQEINCWLLGKGATKVRLWLACDPQRTTKIYRSMLDVGLAYAEKEKAQKVGYDPSDIQWYTPNMIEGLMPLVLDSTYDGLVSSGDLSQEIRSKKPAKEGGDLLACVMDVRRALSLCDPSVHELFMDTEPGGFGWDEAIKQVIDVLGGMGPTVGRRKALSNTTAQAITGSYY